MTGGEMNEHVAMTHSTYAAPPYRFEAGTPMIAQAIGLASACTYLDLLGRESIARHVHGLTGRALNALTAIKGVRVVGPAGSVDRGPAISFTVQNRSPEKIGVFMDERGIAIRAGHLCAQPASARFGLSATARASFYLYTTDAEVDAFASALDELA